VLPDWVVAVMTRFDLLRSCLAVARNRRTLRDWNPNHQASKRQGGSLMRTRVMTVGWVFAIASLSFAVQAAEPATSPASAGPRTQPLDLKAPEVTRLFSLEQINAILSRATDPALEHVEVQAPRWGDLPIDDNSASPAEIVFKSVMSWFVPSRTYAANVNIAPDVTAPLRPAPLMQANYHASFAPPVSQR
jgi:hypothetical protein